MSYNTKQNLKFTWNRCAVAAVRHSSGCVKAGFTFLNKRASMITPLRQKEEQRDRIKTVFTIGPSRNLPENPMGPERALQGPLVGIAGTAAVAKTHCPNNLFP